MDQNNAHGFDGVSVRIWNLSFPSIIKPYPLIFRNRLNFGTFADDWKTDNVVNKEIANKYRAYQLICSKVFEKLVFGANFESMITYIVNMAT